MSLADEPKYLYFLCIVGATGHSWRTRNNAITFGRQSRPKTAHTSKLQPTEFNQLVPLSEIDQKSQRLN